jgi:hypothetical protein
MKFISAVVLLALTSCSVTPHYFSLSDMDGAHEFVAEQLTIGNKSSGPKIKFSYNEATGQFEDQIVVKIREKM